MIRAAVADPPEKNKNKQGSQTRPPRTPRQLRFTARRFGMALMIVAALLIVAGSTVPVTRWADGSGYVMTDLEVELRSSVEGAIQAMVVQTGDIVQKDQLVIQLANAVQRADHEQAQSQLKAKEAEFSSLISSQELDRSQRKEQVLRAEQNLQLAEAYLERMKASEGFSPKEVDEARLRVSIAASELAELRLPAENLREQQIKVLHEQIEAARKQVAALEAQLRQREIRAPLAGQVHLNRFEPGEVIKPEHVLGQIFDRSAWVVKLNLPEHAMAHVTVGQEVKVALAGYPTLKYGYLNARIKHIIPVITPRPNAPGIFYAEATLQVPPDFNIQPGMTASGWVDTGKTTWFKRKIGW